jgi:hypothetical protein
MSAIIYRYALLPLFSSSSQAKKYEFRVFLL